MAISRREARELMSRGYEMGATVLNGMVERRADGVWLVGGKPLAQVLDALLGQEVTLVAAAISEEPGIVHLCRVCGTEYEGHSCPRCREIRQRLRGYD
jgi:rubrerythrin